MGSRQPVYGIILELNIIVKTVTKIQSRLSSDLRIRLALFFFADSYPARGNLPKFSRLRNTFRNASKQSRRRVNLIHSYALRWLKEGVVR